MNINCIGSNYIRQKRINEEFRGDQFTSINIPETPRKPPIMTHLTRAELIQLATARNIEISQDIICSDEQSESLNAMIVREYPQMMSYIVDQSDDVCRIYCENISIQSTELEEIINRIKNIKDEYLIILLGRYAGFIRCIKNPTEDMYRIVLKSNNNHLNIEDYDNFSDELKIEAIKGYPRRIEFFSNPSDELVKLAILSGADNINVNNYIHLISEEDYINLCKEDKYIASNLLQYFPEDRLTDDMMLAISSVSWRAIIDIKNPSRGAIINALSDSTSALQYIEKFITVDIFKEAVKNNPNLIGYIKHLSPEIRSQISLDDRKSMIKESIKDDASNIVYIKDNSINNLDFLLELIEINPNIIPYVAMIRGIDIRHFSLAVQLKPELYKTLMENSTVKQYFQQTLIQHAYDLTSNEDQLISIITETDKETIYSILDKHGN